MSSLMNKMNCLYNTILTPKGGTKLKLKKMAQSCSSLGRIWSRCMAFIGSNPSLTAIVTLLQCASSFLM